MSDAALPQDRLVTPLLGGQPRSAPRLELARATFDFATRVAVMGIVNRTPDSFFDRGTTYELDAATRHARHLIAAGADIVDVGGVKGGPGPDVSVEEELDRVVPVIAALRAATGTLISVDTYRAAVADEALRSGADIVNDVSGASDPDMLATVARHGAGYVVMHHGGEPRTRPFRRGYNEGVTAAVVEHCRALAAAAVAAGIPRECLLVDPGHDFQKTTWHSLELSRRLPELAALGLPVLVALSNKDFIGETLDLPLEQRLEGSLAAAVFCILRGANVVRVHDVAATVRAVRMTEALLGWRRPAVAVRGLE